MSLDSADPISLDNKNKINELRRLVKSTTDA